MALYVVYACVYYTYFAFGSGIRDWHEGSNATFIKSLVVDDERSGHWLESVL